MTCELPLGRTRQAPKALAEHLLRNFVAETRYHGVALLTKPP
jgi:hypothetical protein